MRHVFKKIAICLTLLAIPGWSPSEVWACALHFTQTDSPSEDPLALVRKQLEQLEISDLITPVVGNATLDTFQVMIVGQQHGSRNGERNPVGFLVNSALLNRYARPGDLILLEGEFRTDRDLHETEILVDDLFSTTVSGLRFRGWDHIGFHTATLYGVDLWFMGRFPAKFSGDFDRVMSFLGFQRNAYLAQRIRESTGDFQNPQRVIVLAGSGHADGLEGVLHKTLADSGLKYVVLSQPLWNERRDDLRALMNACSRDHIAGLARDLMLKSDQLGVRIKEGFPEDHQTDFGFQELHF